VTTVTAPASQATGRQRGDSIRPVGNNKGVKTSVRARTSHHGQEPHQAARVAPGSGDGVDQVPQGAAQAVEFPDDQGVAGTELVQELLEGGAVGAGAAGGLGNTR
jgi:hypothetical protein